MPDETLRRLAVLLLSALTGLLLLALLNVLNMPSLDSYPEQMAGVFFFFFFPWLFFLAIWLLVVAKVGFLKTNYENNRIPAPLGILLLLLCFFPVTSFYGEKHRFIVWDAMTYLVFFLSAKFALLMNRS